MRFVNEPQSMLCTLAFCIVSIEISMEFALLTAIHTTIAKLHWSELHIVKRTNLDRVPIDCHGSTLPQQTYRRTHITLQKNWLFEL